MKKNMIVGIALAMGILSVGAISASAAGSCCNSGKCTDKQVALQFPQETAVLTSALTAKDNELQELYAYRGWDRTFEGINVRKINALETEMKQLKVKINASAQNYSVPACSCS